MAQQVQLTATVSESQLGQRLDQTLAELFPDYSRSRIKEWILDRRVTVNGVMVDTPKEKVLGGELVAIDAEIEEAQRWEPQNLPLDIVYEDEDIIVINKPRDFVVHPGAGNPDGTVLNALLHHYPAIMDVPRAGIVHRLDKDTTGLMVVAKTVPAQTHLVDSLQRREITREYEAVAIGNMTAGGTVEQPISRHSTKRTHMRYTQWVNRRSLITASWSTSGPIPVCACVWKPVVLTRSACICLTSAIRWWAIRFTVAVRVRQKARQRHLLLRCAVSIVRHCTPRCCASITLSAVLKWNSMLRFRRTWLI